MSAVAGVRDGAAGIDERSRKYMSGDLCRCAAYANIVKAVKQAQGRWEERRGAGDRAVKSRVYGREFVAFAAAMMAVNARDIETMLPFPLAEIGRALLVAADNDRQ